MKNALQQLMYFFIGILLLVIGGYFSFSIIGIGIHAVAGLSGGAKVTLLVALLGAGSTLFGVFFTKIRERKIQIEANHNEKSSFFTATLPSCS